jgi:hypothetical protein
MGLRLRSDPGRARAIRDMKTVTDQTGINVGRSGPFSPGAPHPSPGDPRGHSRRSRNRSATDVASPHLGVPAAPAAA